MSPGHLDLEGLFLVNGNAERVDWLRQRYDSGEEVELEKEADLASAVSLLRLFLQELPEPVIPTAIQGHILQLHQGVWQVLLSHFSCHPVFPLRSFLSLLLFETNHLCSVLRMKWMSVRRFIPFSWTRYTYQEHPEAISSNVSVNAILLFFLNPFVKADCLAKVLLIA